MEAKVREATNDEPWCVFYVSISISIGADDADMRRGASSTLMQDIATG